MDRIDFFLLRKRHDSGNVEIRLHRALTGSNLISLVGLEAVQRQPVFLRINCHCAQAKFIGGAKNPDGDFAAIGRQQFADRSRTCHSESSRSMREILHCFTEVARDSAMEILIWPKEVIYDGIFDQKRYRARSES